MAAGEAAVVVAPGPGLLQGRGSFRHRDRKKEGVGTDPPTMHAQPGGWWEYLSFKSRTTVTHSGKPRSRQCRTSAATQSA